MNRLVKAGLAVGDVAVALTRDRDDVGVMIISRENYLVFSPMVAGVISSGIDAHNVIQPLRRALIRAGASFRRAELASVDYEKKTVTIENGAELPYDHLVLALGTQPNYFSIPGVEEHGQTMKGISDAEAIRDRVVGRFEETTRATYLYKLESPQGRARVASDWLLGLFARPAVPRMREDATGGPERPVEETP
jgi:NADH dehydrogenase